MSLGLSYQYLDDVADVVADPDAVGKDIGVDDGKPTAVSLFGVEGARSRSTQFQEEALAQLEPYGPEAACLRSLIMQASWAPA
jgi:farnesyl diphosphate synthase